MAADVVASTDPGRGPIRGSGHLESGSVSPDHRRSRILVIEDNRDSADTLREVLELWGYEVAVAYDGTQGVADARDWRPDLVLCDLGLPGMNGLEVARVFRSDECLKHARLVALTAYTLPGHAAAAIEAGFERHLSKPADLHELERLLAHAA